MSPAQARAIIGETAQALDAGARKGLHHLNLSPESIRILPDGTVKVSGLGIEAAALDLESRVAGHDPSAADRADARSLVEILYYGLTGRWPGKRPRHSLRATTGRRPGQALHARAGNRPGPG